MAFSFFRSWWDFLLFVLKNKRVQCWVGSRLQLGAASTSLFLIPKTQTSSVDMTLTTVLSAGLFTTSLEGFGQTTSESHTAEIAD